MPAFSDNVVAQRALRRLGSSLCGRYSILRLIGIGGMAAVYAGVHRNGHAVAIKILHERLATDPEIERLFRREAQLANRVGHPGVLPVIDDDVTEDGCVFLVMPLLEGETLRARAERQGRKLPIAEVVVLAHSLLETLAAAHAKKIVHRDIKPENVFVTTAGEVKVLDFGIGRFFESNEPGSATRSGRALGTPAFMAPEQALGRMREVDGRTDIWALGATMFSLLSGRFVHEAESPTEIAVLAATRPARSLGEVAPEVPTALREVVDRALSFKREGRWADAGEMDRALLGACEAALGLVASSLPSLAVPLPERGEDLDTVATHVPEVQPIAGSPESRFSNIPRTQAELLLPDVATRTTPPTVGPVHALPWRRHLFPLRVVLVCVAVSMTLLGLGFRARFARHESVSSGPLQRAAQVDASPKSRDSDLTAVLTPNIPAAAMADYRAGIQLWRDASSLDSLGRFKSATLVAPDFAAAHLWFVLVSWQVSAKLREHYANATLHRSTLSELQLNVLDALQPAVQDPPNRLAAAERLGHVIDKEPSNTDLRMILATYYERMGDRARGAQLLDPVLSLPSPAPVALYLHARLFSLTSTLEASAEDVSRSLRTCVSSSPSGTDCLYDLARIDANEGRCAELEPIARQEMTRQPTSWLPYSDFADALYSTERPLDAVRAALDEESRRISDEGIRRRVRAREAIDLAIAAGRLLDARTLAEAYRLLVAREGDSGISQVRPYEYQVLLATELGDTASAIAIARDFANESASWPRSENVDLASETVYLGSTAGDLMPEGRDVLRKQILATAEDPAYGAPYRRWINAYATAAWTPPEALEALSQIPSEPLPGPQYRDASDDYMFGRVFALAGRTATAKQFFFRAAHSCSLSGDLFRTKAKYELGQMEEGTPAVACALYSEILGHWRLSPQSVTIRRAKERLLALSCKTPSTTLLGKE
ncbi:MAG: protein kinase domain-containing protein [Polyangiaceae bacterium]